MLGRRRRRRSYHGFAHRAIAWQRASWHCTALCIQGLYRLFDLGTGKSAFAFIARPFHRHLFPLATYATITNHPLTCRRSGHLKPHGHPADIPARAGDGLLAPSQSTSLPRSGRWFCPFRCLGTLLPLLLRLSRSQYRLRQTQYRHPGSLLSATGPVLSVQFSTSRPDHAHYNCLLHGRTMLHKKMAATPPAARPDSIPRLYRQSRRRLYERSLPQHALFRCRATDLTQSPFRRPPAFVYCPRRYPSHRAGHALFPTAQRIRLPKRAGKPPYRRRIRQLSHQYRPVVRPYHRRPLSAASVGRPRPYNRGKSQCHRAGRHHLHQPRHSRFLRRPPYPPPRRFGYHRPFARAVAGLRRCRLGTGPLRAHHAGRIYRKPSLRL